MKNIIACDLDGCLVDFNSGFAKLLRSINPTVKLDPFDTLFPSVWDWPSHYGYSADDEIKAWTEVRNSGVFWRGLFPYATAWEDLELLNSKRDAWDIYFLTTRPGKTAKMESEAWLAQHGFKNPTVVISGDKQLFCEAVTASMIIDDRIDNLMNQSGAVKTALFKRPYNEGYRGIFNMDVSSLREALKDVV